MNNRVVISGLGVVSAIGHDIDTFWHNCLAGKSAIEPIPDLWKGLYPTKSKFWSRLPLPDYKKHGFSNFLLKKMDPSTLNALICTEDALRDANLEVIDKKKSGKVIQNYKANELGVFVGTGAGGISSFIKSYNNQSMSGATKLVADIAKQLPDDQKHLANALIDTLTFEKKFNPFVVSMHMPNSCAANLGIHYNATGLCNTYTYACAASTIAIGEAYEAIHSGKIQCAIAGGTEYLEDPYGAIFRAFDEGGTVTRKENPDNCNCPFDKSHSGFLFSEGASSILILENYDSAIKRGAKIYAEVSGFERSFEAYSPMIMEPSGDHIKTMINTLLKRTNKKPDQIDYINAHGTGTVTNDTVETKVIESIFGQHPYVNSTKSIVGHPLGAAGAIEATVTALSIKNSIVHPSVNISDPVTPLRFPPTKISHTINNAISQSFAFGGHNAAIMLSHLK